MQTKDRKVPAGWQTRTQNCCEETGLTTAPLCHPDVHIVSINQINDSCMAQKEEFERTPGEEKMKRIGKGGPV